MVALCDSASRYPLRRTSSRLKQMEVKIETPMSSCTSTAKPKRSAKSADPAKKKPKLEESTQLNGMAEKDADAANGGAEVVLNPTIVSSSASADSGNVYAMVTETIRTFNKHYLQCIQEEEKRYAEREADKNKKSKQNGKTEDNEKNASKRPDLKAITQMLKEKTNLYHEKRIGHIPGIDVGHQFYSRAEMVVVGIHKHWLNGIDYIGKNSKRTSGELGLSGCEFPLTVSIVLSGQYEDDLDNCDEIVYTGQGGNDLLGNKRQIGDQVMERGNLGLKNSMEGSVPVRVIRGRKCPESYVGKVYTYDGLYKVVNYWAENGVSGFTVYKFRLKRLEGQQPLTTDQQVQFERGRIPRSMSEIQGLVCDDITRGLEYMPIPVTNLVEDPPILPEGFTYINEMKFSKNVDVPTVDPTGCNCRGGTCFDPRSCGCAKLNGGDFPYVQKDGGRLVEPKGVVFECGPHCGCGPKCVNKTSQRGPKYRLEVFRTPKKGWGVRSWDYIPSGAPVCEYIGLLKRTDDIDPEADNSYVFDIDCLQTMKGLGGRESRLRDVLLPSHLPSLGEEVSESVPYCIDAVKTGNVTRFINHSCQPNLFVQCTLSTHHDMRLARIVLVAADNIPPLKELSYDYGYALDSVLGPDGTIQKLACLCGAQGCRGRLY